MSIFDASVVVDALVDPGRRGDAARSAVLGTVVLHLPEVHVAEVVSALRSMLLRGEIDAGRARTAMDDLRMMAKHTYPIEPFLDRIWELRDRVTVYDGWYIALAEILSTSLITADVRLTKVPGLNCEVLLPT